MSGYKPFPSGTVRGPYTYDSSVQFLVQTKGGWVPFIRNISQESECRRAAEDYAKDVLRAEADGLTVSERNDLLSAHARLGVNEGIAVDVPDELRPEHLRWPSLVKQFHLTHHDTTPARA